MRKQKTNISHGALLEDEAAVVHAERGVEAAAPGHLVGGDTHAHERKDCATRCATRISSWSAKGSRGRKIGARGLKTQSRGGIPMVGVP